MEGSFREISGIVRRVLRDRSSGYIPASQYKLQSAKMTPRFSKVNTRDLTGEVRSSNHSVELRRRKGFSIWNFEINSFYLKMSRF